VAVVVILVLAVLWAAVLLPPILRARAEGGGSGVSGGIAEVMSTFSSLTARLRGDDPDLPPVSPQFGPVGQINGVGPARKPGGMTPAQRRRRDVLVGLLCAAVLGAGLGWAGPACYLVVGAYGLYTQWHGPALTTPWIWPARPPHDLGAALCAGLVTAAGLAVFTARGARDPAGE